MDLRRDLQRRAKQVALPMLGACLAGYFVYHAIHGDRGIIAWLQLNQQLKVAQSQLDRTTTDRQAMEQRVALLSNSSLDLDMLEERARVMLNFAHPDDLIIFLKNAPSGSVVTPDTQAN